LIKSKQGAPGAPFHGIELASQFSLDNIGRLIMAEEKQIYRKKQAYLMVLVFVCLGIAIWGQSAPVAVVAILAACGICFYASTMEPERKPEEHHH